MSENGQEQKREDLYQKILNDELTWENLVIDIVREQGIDPWNIDVSKLTKAYLAKIKELKDLNFRLSGKILLIAAILLRMKSKHFAFKEDKNEQEQQEHVSLLEDITLEVRDLEPRIPLPKTRKVTLQELMGALDSALTVKNRKEARHERMHALQERKKFEHTFKEMKISQKLTLVFDRLRSLFSTLKKRTLPFSKLTPSQSREDIIWTFIPLIILSNRGRVNLLQEKSFGDIMVEIVDDSDLAKEELNENDEQQ
ncbi:hypothetical protein COT72_04165 [archaeon CG10_big_fil_rev_8_21_14_0_10_43_11]|nr:MAG: hypothetical protein COT72_04165 [archaeon CG10_big_fil_rev_8_21_14_0_10_43_11]